MVDGHGSLDVTFGYVRELNAQRTQKCACGKRVCFVKTHAAKVGSAGGKLQVSGFRLKVVVKKNRHEGGFHCIYYKLEVRLIFVITEFQIVFRFLSE